MMLVVLLSWLKRFQKPSFLLRLTLLALLLSACVMPGDAAPVVKIGLIAPFEGLGRPLGYEVLPVVKSALAEANANGTLGRYRVALVALNDDLDPQSAATQAQVLAQDGGVLAVLGPWSSETATAAAPVLAQAGIPGLVAAPLAPDPMGGLYSLCLSQAQIAAELRVEARRLGKVYGAVGVKGDLTVIYAGNAASAADDLIHWRAAGWQGVLLGGPDLVRPWLVERAGDAAEGVRAVVCVPAGVQGQENSGPDAILADAGARAILQALAEDIAAHGRPTRGGVAAALSGQPITPGLVWYRVRDSAWERCPASVCR